MVESEPKLGKRDKPESGGGAVVDKRWELETDAEQRIQFLKNLELKSFDCLKDLERTECPGCKKSVKYYCVNCYKSMVDSPQLNLPIKVTVVTHPNEKKKSSIVPAKVLAPNDIDILFTHTEVPKFTEASDEIVLLFPGNDAK